MSKPSAIANASPASRSADSISPWCAQTSARRAFAEAIDGSCCVNSACSTAVSTSWAATVSRPDHVSSSTSRRSNAPPSVSSPASSAARRPASMSARARSQSSIQTAQSIGVVLTFQSRSAAAACNASPRAMAS